jgi:hypothetical protein
MKNLIEKHKKWRLEIALNTARNLCMDEKVGDLQST